MSLTQKYLENIEKKLREFGEKIDEVNAKIKSDTTMQYDEKIGSLKKQMEEAFSKVNESIDSQLKEWGGKIEELTDHKKEDARKEYEELVSKLRPKINEFRNELGKLKKSGDEAITEVKSGTSSAWKELKNSFSRAISKFRSDKPDQ